MQAAQGATTAASSDSSVATAVITGSPTPITLHLDVSSAASAAQETSTASVSDSSADSLAADGLFTLTIGSQTAAFDLTQPGQENTLDGLGDYINAADLGITATIINTSSDAEAPAYHLTLVADDTGGTTLSLKDSGDVELLTQVNQGSDAVFSVDGVAVTNSENTIIDFAPGLTLTIVDEGSATVTVQSDVEALSTTLAEIAGQYNAVAARLNSHTGEDAGVLSGDSLIRETRVALREITGALGDGSVLSIADLGLEFDDHGVLSFDASKFNSTAGTDFEGVLAFLGGTTEGFAGEGYQRLSSLSDPVTGGIQTAVEYLQESDRTLQTQIDTAQERIDLLIQTLEQQFAAADVLLAQLESQQDLLTRLFAANDAKS